MRKHEREEVRNLINNLKSDCSIASSLSTHWIGSTLHHECRCALLVTLSDVPLPPPLRLQSPVTACPAWRTANLSVWLSARQGNIEREVQVTGFAIFHAFPLTVPAAPQAMNTPPHAD